MSCSGCGGEHPWDRPCPDGTRWATSMAACAVCGHQWALVWPVARCCMVSDEVTTECPQCGYQGKAALVSRD